MMLQATPANGGRMNITKKLPFTLVTCAALGALATAVGVASATTEPPPGPVQTLIVDRADAQIRVVQAEGDDFDSGWHTHPGVAIVQVHEGELQIYQGSCGPTIVGPGETFIETPELAVKGVGVGHVEWTTTLIVPTGAEFATPAEDPCA